MYTLGINAVYHDPAACLVRDGRIIAAAEEERFTRRKHGKRPEPFSTYELPFHAIDYCLREAGIRLVDVGHVAYSYDPHVLLGRYEHNGTIELPLEPSAHPAPREWESAWDPLFLSSIVNAPRHLAGGVPHHLKRRFEGARPDGPYRWHFVEHHTAHAASAFHASPFSQAAVLTLDGRGELATTAYHEAAGRALERLGQVDMPHSLGLLYERITQYLGFLHASDEYKVMALAALGKPRFIADFRRMVRLGADGQYTVDSGRLEERFGPARQPGGPMEPRHYDVASSLQLSLEETAEALADWLYRRTSAKALCLAGGVALNCVMNARLRDLRLFDRVWVQPAAGDAGTALGAALWIDAQQPRRGTPESRQGRPGRMDHAFLGPSYTDEEIEALLRWSKLHYRRSDRLADEAAALLSQDKILGWFQGRMEFGPRALGGRSILASPLSPDMQQRLNELKDREDFRPVAPVVLEEEAAAWFERGDQSPFMLFVDRVRPERSDRIPAVRHVDGTARVQTINRDQQPQLYDLLKAFHALTGVPILVNTSFNTRGEPIVCSPRDAIEAFWSSPLDALVIGSYLLEKPRSPA